MASSSYAYGSCGVTADSLRYDDSSLTARMEEDEEDSNGTNTKGGRKDKKSNPLISPTEKCRVCAEPAAKHIHYGSVTCFSCRAFFRRTVQHFNVVPPKKPYVCKKQNACEMSLKTRKSCQKCRFEKCLAVGMKMSWVLSEEERHKRFRKNRDKKAKEKEKDDDEFQEEEEESVEEVQRPSFNEEEQEVLRKRMRLAGLVAMNRQNTEGYFNSQPLQIPPATPIHKLINPYNHPMPPENMYQTTSHYAPSMPAFPEHLPPRLAPKREPFSSPPLLPPPPPTKAPGMIRTSTLLPPLPSTFPSCSYDMDSVEAVPVSRAPLPMVPPQMIPPARATAGPSSQYVHPYMMPNPVKQEPVAPPAEQNNDDDAKSEVSSSAHSGGSSSGIDPILMEPLVEISDDEVFTIKNLVGNHELAYKSVPFGEELIKEMVMCSAFGMPLSPSAAVTAYRLMVQRVTKVAQSFDMFTQGLANSTQATLLQQNADLLVSLRAAVFFEQKKKGLDQILLSFGMDDLEQGKSIIMATLQRSGYLGHISYDSFNSIQDTSNSESETRYNLLLERVGSTVGCKTEYVTLLTFIALFSSDGIRDSRVRAEVEGVQEMLTTMLRRFVRSQCGRGRAHVGVLGSLLSCVADLQELTHLKRQRALSERSKVAELINKS